ncbi:MAG: sigma-70 family RNA polymerase sigma factor [Planctomycetota bacterium]|nr:sigma-70 family RNA polymerase sigma factor [Planctomycetota bacterium]MCZ6815175.1 sigma-70 family RNA polymerase sigma factor [Planctomycetota bacterium]
METHDADSFLIEAIRHGDQRAWRQLIDRYQGRLLAFARSRLGAGSDAEDALQETFLGFVTSLKHFDAGRSLETYLFAILRYKIGEVLTKKQRRSEVTAGFDIEDDAPGLPEPSVSETPSGIAAKREGSDRQADVIATILRRLIEELRDKGRLEDLRVIELLFYVGLRNKEAGELLGRDEKAIAGVKFRALGRLREFLAELQEDDRGLLDDQRLFGDTTIARVWRRRRLSCLKRNTLGSYLLGVLDEPWLSYTAFHLDTVKCLMCRANAEDLSEDAGELSTAERGEEMFQSSVGFLSRIDEA